MTSPMFIQGLALRIRQLAETKGQTLVELLLAIALATLLLPALLTGLVASREGKAQQGNKLSATALIKDGIEAVRQVREAGWTNVATNGAFHPVRTGGTWTLEAGAETIEIYTRSVTIADVSRDTNGVIVSSGGIADPSTKQVTVSLAWTQPFPYSLTTTLYLTRWLGNTTFTQTTEADFQGGTTTNTTVTNDNGGEVVLGAGGGGNWCAPNLNITALDLPKSGVANGISATEGFVYAGTGDNASGESYAKVSIANTNPPVASIAGTLGNYKTNDVFGEPNFGYIATDTNSKEIVIIDIGSTPFAEVGYFNAPGTTDADSVFVVGNSGYMTQGNVLRNFDLSAKTGSRPAIDDDGVTFTDTAGSVVVVGSYAYVAVDTTSAQLQIVSLADPSNLTIVGQAQVDGKEGIDVYVNSSGTRAYLATETSLTKKEIFIIDVSSKTGNQPVMGSYDTNGMNPKGITVVPGNRAIVVGNSGEEYQVMNIATETSPTRCGGLEINSGINGIDSVLEADGDAYSYIITGDTTTELKIIEGGPGGQFSTSGAFESSTIDTGVNVAFNNFVANAIIPAQTTLTYQVAATDAVSSSCNGVSFTFVGPDGTSGSYYTQGASIPTSDDGAGFENPARCLRYRANFATTEKTISPTFTDITVNYSR